MDIENVAADAPATDTSMPDAPVETVDVMADARAIWDKRETEPETEEAPAVEATPEAAEEPAAEETPAEETAPVVDAPGDLPWGVREHWASIPEAARNAFVESQREMARKTADMSRQVQGLKPFQDSLVELAQKRPQMREMTPQQILQYTDRISDWGERLASDFDGTMSEIFKAHGREYAAGQKAEGGQSTALEQANASLRQEIAEMKRQMEQVANPDYISTQIEQRLATEKLQAEIDQFAAGKSNWAQVQPYLEMTAPMARAKLGDSASVQDVLAEAYNIAVTTFVSQPMAPPGVGGQPAPQVDPGKAKAARDINVKSDQSSGAKPLTARQQAKKIWEARNS